MILDRIENAHLYYRVHKRFQNAFDYISKINIHTLPVGRHEIDGTNMYALVQEYSTKPKEKGIWEAHRCYIDLQYVVQGAEGIGYANIHQLRQGEYDDSRDFLPLHGQGGLLTLTSGSFVLLMPEDAHMPGLVIGEPADVRKIVVKIAVE
jgi:YhcH/YjgK/YiaL family protein